MILAKHPEGLQPAIYQNRTSFFVDGKFDNEAYYLATQTAQELISVEDFNAWQNGSWFDGVTAVLSPEDEQQFIKQLQGRTMYYGSKSEISGTHPTLGDETVYAFTHYIDAKYWGGEGSSVLDFQVYPKTPCIFEDSGTCIGIHEHPTLLSDIKAAGHDCIVGLDNDLVVILNESLFKP